MKIYNKITLELFGFINFEKPTLFRNFKRDHAFYTTKYCYFFPQKVDTWSGKFKIETMYFFLFWRIITYHIDRTNKYR